MHHGKYEKLAIHRHCNNGIIIDADICCRCAQGHHLVV